VISGFLLVEYLLLSLCNMLQWYQTRKYPYRPYGPCETCGFWISLSSEC